MNPRASVYFDSSRLSDVLLIEGRNLFVGDFSIDATETKLPLSLDSDEFVDELIDVLTKHRDYGIRNRLWQKIARLEKRHTELGDRLNENQKSWTVIETARTEAYQELLDARAELNKLTEGDS